MGNTIITVVGNRPQFVKMAPLSHEFKKRNGNEFIIHTGQHYDKNLNEVFFQEMDIPNPDRQLTIKSHKHGGMTAEMLVELEKIFEEKKPKGVLIYGDTNSTLAAALAAVKLKIRIAHVEAGPRIYDIDSPEEINRIVADHSALVRFCPDTQSVENLAKENITKNVHFSGDLMFDSYLKYSKIAEKQSNVIAQYKIDTPFILLTVHRPNNTDSKKAITNLLAFIEKLPEKVVFPIHPRTKAAIQKYQLWDDFNNCNNLISLPAVGYLEILSLLNASKYVITDSGGLQKEAYFAKKLGGVLFFDTPWPQLKSTRWSYLLGTLEDIDLESASKLLESKSIPNEHHSFFGDGFAAAKIADVLEEMGWLP